MASRDMDGVASTLHFPFATFDEIFGEVDPIVYKTADDFVKNPPPSMKVGTGDDATLKPDTYDILDNMQFFLSLLHINNCQVFEGYWAFHRI